MKVEVNSFLAMVAVSNFEILRLKKGFSKIFLIDGRCAGFLISISSIKSFKSYE